MGAVVFKNEKILLIKRKNPPSQGLWAIPGGVIELGETIQEAAEREILEETGVVIRAESPVFTFDAIVRDSDGRVRYHYIIVDVLAEYLSGGLIPGDDAADAGWFLPSELDTLPLSSPTKELLDTLFRRQNTAE